MKPETQAEVQARLDALKAKAVERADPVLEEIAGLLGDILSAVSKLPDLPEKKPGQKRGRK